MENKKKIPRLKGESDIVYIGQTSKSLSKRHASSSKIKATSKANKQKYNDIVTSYGEITIYYMKQEDFNTHEKLSLREIEGHFLWWYFKNHSEYPPVNYIKTKIRKDMYPSISK